MMLGVENLGLRAVVRRVLPAGIRRVLRQAIAASNAYLDHLAVRRVREALRVKTNDAITTRWLGRQIWQYPVDAWIIQEMIAHLRPDLIIETGTYLGGSAYFLASLCDLLDHGEVISIDIAARGTIAHPRITYLQGSSIAPDIVAMVTERARKAPSQRILIVLDSDHTANHVRQELEAYAPLVPEGSYIHVQDGDIDELSVYKQYRPGPMAAAIAFLKDHPQFVRDLEVETRYVMTEHPYGWLKRIALD